MSTVGGNLTGCFERQVQRRVGVSGSLSAGRCARQLRWADFQRNPARAGAILDYICVGADSAQLRFHGQLNSDRILERYVICIKYRENRYEEKLVKRRNGSRVHALQ